MSEGRKLTLALLWAGVVVNLVFGYIATRMWVLSLLLIAAAFVLTIRGRRAPERPTGPQRSRGSTPMS